MNYYIIPPNVKVDSSSKFCTTTNCRQMECGQCVFRGRYREILEHLLAAGLLTDRVLYE